MGALPEQTSEFAFSAGLQEKEDSWLSSSGFSTLHNCIQEKTGALVKIPGYSAVSSASRNGDQNFGSVGGLLMDIGAELPGANMRLIKRDQQVGIVDSLGLLWSKADKWTLQGRVSPWVCEQRVVCETASGYFECCCSGDWVYSAFEHAAGDIRIAVTYLPTNETLSLLVGANLPVGVGAHEPRIVAIDNAGTALLFYMTSTGGMYHVVTPDGVMPSHNITLAFGYDVVSDPVAQSVWVVYLQSPNIASTQYSYSAATRTLTSASTLTVTGLNNAIVCSMCVDLANSKLVLCWVEYISAGGGNYYMTVRALSAALDFSASYWTRSVWQAATFEPINPLHAIQNVGVAASTTDGYFISFTDLQNERIVGRWVSYAGVVEGGSSPGDDSGSFVAQQCWARTRPAWDPTTARMFLLADAGLHTTRRAHVLLGVEPRSVAGKASPTVRTMGVLGLFSYLTAGISGVSVSTDNLRISRPFQDKAGSWHVQSYELGGQGGTLQLLVDYALISDDRVGQFAELGSATYVAGAVLSLWDGVRVAEAGFSLDPLPPVPTAGSGGAMATGTYQYMVTYARVTASGELVRSRPSLSTQGQIVSGPGKMTVTAAPPGPSNIIDGPSNISGSNFSGIYVEFWRSEVNTTSPLLFAGRTYVDWTSSAAVSFTDTAASYAGNEQLYSDGTNGEIANTPPPSPISVCQWRNRLWATDGAQVFYTKEAASTRAAEWSQAFFVMSRGAPERLTAVAPLGEVLMAFAKDSSSYVYGDAPGANGQGSTLVGPVPIISELGCTQAAGIAQLPDGLLVPTRRGLQLLSGKREYSYVGAAIEDTLAAFPLVRCARHISGTNRVWLSLAAADLATGIAVIYDTHHKTFATTLSSAELGFGQGIHCSSIDVGGAHTISLNDWVYDQTPGAFLFGSTLTYNQTIETPWFKANGPSGELRARRFIMLLKRLGACQLKIDIGYDFEDAYHYGLQLNDAALVAMEGEPDTLKPRVPFPRQRCQAYRFRFTVLPPSAGVGTAGLRFVSLRMSTSLRPGSGKRLSAVNSEAAFTKS